MGPCRAWTGIVIACTLAAAQGCAARAAGVLPELRPHLVCFYDFEHPVSDDEGRERDRGSSATMLQLINGGAAMRVEDGAHAGSTLSLQTRQINPNAAGNDDWKAGVYDAAGAGTMAAFASSDGITVMGWIKPTGINPSPNSNTPAPGDMFNAVGLFGILSGDSDGHGVRALLEIIQVAATPRLVALGRRIDGGSSRTLAADDPWQTLLPEGTWTHMTATFSFDEGTMALYRNGEPLAASYTSDADAWQVSGTPEPDRTSPSAPTGIKIGGSFPQNTAERNPFNGRLDDLMFFDKALTGDEVRRQYGHMVEAP